VRNASILGSSSPIREPLFASRYGVTSRKTWMYVITTLRMSHLVVQGTELCTVTPNICVPSVWNFFHVTLLASGVLRWFLQFYEISALLLWWKITCSLKTPYIGHSPLLPCRSTAGNVELLYSHEENYFPWKATVTGLFGKLFGTHSPDAINQRVCLDLLLLKKWFPITTAENSEFVAAINVNCCCYFKFVIRAATCHVGTDASGGHWRCAGEKMLLLGMVTGYGQDNLESWFDFQQEPDSFIFPTSYRPSTL